ncbi:hypothetical protein CPB83DRAFT_834933 [Crepidotus variabilis]|uniref:Uncharacterized protein n=1 Tax=Crepidotus variabilis TaxID=179855 RepID=A0A9P6EI57_9AGAR|nr:hypothetical protein CPB83DRAFT_834933 [Crepidotus variabilis]
MVADYASAAYHSFEASKLIIECSRNRKYEDTVNVYQLQPGCVHLTSISPLLSPLSTTASNVIIRDALVVRSQFYRPRLNIDSKLHGSQVQRTLSVYAVNLNRSLLVPAVLRFGRLPKELMSQPTLLVSLRLTCWFSQWCLAFGVEHGRPSGIFIFEASEYLTT